MCSLRPFRYNPKAWFKNCTLLNAKTCNTADDCTRQESRQRKLFSHIPVFHKKTIPFVRRVMQLLPTTADNAPLLVLGMHRDLTCVVFHIWISMGGFVLLRLMAWQAAMLDPQASEAGRGRCPSNGPSRVVFLFVCCSIGFLVALETPERYAFVRKVRGTNPYRMALPLSSIVQGPIHVQEVHTKKRRKRPSLSPCYKSLNYGWCKTKNWFSIYCSAKLPGDGWIRI